MEKHVKRYIIVCKCFCIIFSLPDQKEWLETVTQFMIITIAYHPLFSQLQYTSHPLYSPHCFGTNCRCIWLGHGRCGSLRISALDSGFQAVQIRVLARVCVLGQDTWLSQCLSPPEYKWVLTNCQGNLLCSTDRDEADFVVKKRRHHFQELRLFGRLRGSQRWFYWLLLLLLPNELPPRDLHRRRRRNQGTVSNCRQHDRMGVIMGQTRLSQLLRCISLEWKVPVVLTIFILKNLVIH